MTESGPVDTVAVGMSIVGYEIGYSRTQLEDPSIHVSSTLHISMSLSGGKVPHHSNQRVRGATVYFLEGPIDPEERERVGVLSVNDETFELGMTVRLPLVDFPGIWAILQLKRIPRLECIFERETAGTSNVVKFLVASRGPLLFG